MPASPQPNCEFDPNKLVLRFETTLPADLDRIAPVVESVMQLVRRMGCAAGHEFEVELATSEAITNAVRHGCKGDATKQIQFSVSCDESRGMLIVVRDPGTGFEPESIPSPVVGQQIWATGGRGIFLINQLMDKVQFENGGTEIRMLKK